MNTPPTGGSGQIRGKEERVRTRSPSTTTGGTHQRVCTIQRPIRTGVATSLDVVGLGWLRDAARMATTPNASTLRTLVRVAFTLSAHSPRGIWVRVQILPRHRPDAFPPQRKLRLREQRPRRILTLGGRTPMPGRKSPGLTWGSVFAVDAPFWYVLV